MKKYQKKVMTTILILALTIAALMSTFPAAQAEDTTTYSYISVEPNPVGVNTEVIVSVWILPIQPAASDIFHGLTVTITKSDGSTETKTMETSTVGSQYFIYTPTAVGAYKFKLSYAGETFSTGNVYYKPSESPEMTLTVQAEQVSPYQDTPIPTGYWERPIDGKNRLWSSISGDWLATAYNDTGKSFDAAFGFNPYTQAPRSAHIMWTKPLALGGLIGGELGDISYYAGLSYETKFTPPIVMDGRLYYNLWPSGFGSPTFPGFVCVDLRTGEEIFRNNNYTISRGQVYNFVSGNQMGGIPMLWNFGFASYEMFDAFTGDLLCTFMNAQSGTVVTNSQGEMFVYVYDGVGNTITKWSSTKCLAEAGIIQGHFIGGSEGAFRFAQGTFDWTKGIEWTKSIPPHTKTVAVTNPDGTTSNQVLTPSTFGVTGNTLLAQISLLGALVYYEIGYSLTDGSEMWIKERNTSTPGVWGSTGSGKYIRYFMDTRTQRCYDAANGNELWVSEAMDFPWGSFGSQYGTVAYDKFYFGGYDGNEYAFNLADGKIAWKSDSGNAGTETPYGSYPMWYGPVVGGNVVFVGTGEHSPTQPLIRGEQLFAFDAQTGSKLWSISGFMVVRAIADGYLLAYNGYDNQIYCFGKGPSKTTVAAPQTAVPRGVAMVITGTVTDQSKGLKDTPAIADANMAAWMEYKFMDQPMPGASGVPLKLTAIAADGSSTEIGTVYSDASGVFVSSWTPDKEGVFKIVAAFDGSDSYGGSYAETGVVVSSSTTGTAQQSGAIATEVYILVAAVVILIVIVVAVLVLRKK